MGLRDSKRNEGETTFLIMVTNKEKEVGGGPPAPGMPSALTKVSFLLVVKAKGSSRERGGFASLDFL